MRKRRLDIVLAFAIFLSCSPGVFPQSKSASVTTPAASSSYDPHDLSGVWFDDHRRLIRVQDRYWAYKFTMEEPPMTPWAQAQFKAAKPSFGPNAVPLTETNDPIYRTCVPMGFPRIFLYPLPFQIIQAPGEVLMIFEYDGVRHQIFTDGRAHDTTLSPLWMGDSIGHWEGDTLVADTMNFNGKTWIDRIGHPHSEALHVIERIRRIDRDHLVDDITIDDPKAYTKPWTAHLPFVLKPKWTLAEVFCEDENSFQDIEENETKPAK